MADSSIEKVLEVGKSLVTYSFAAYVLYYIGQLIYNVFFHPLASYPGPLLWRASRLPYVIHALRGTLPFDVLAHFETYGPIVRIAPNELAYGHADAHKQLLGPGTKGPGGAEMGHWQPFYRPDESIPQDLLSADRELHGKLRKQLALGFSERSMRAQEPTLRAYTDKLMAQLRKHSDGGKTPLDMVTWYNFLTFDVIGDLAFGESFGCLENGEHWWVGHVLKMMQLTTWIHMAVHYPWLCKVLFRNMPAKFKEVYENSYDFAAKRVAKRIAKGTERKDLIEGLLQKQGELELSERELVAHANLLIIAGSDTWATLLSGVTYLLLKSPDKLEMLKKEVREAFERDEEITIESTSRLPYLLACLDEALRIYPPINGGLPRQVPQGGKTVLGKYVAEGSVVAIWQWAINHYSQNWSDPYVFHPERFLDGQEGKDGEFASDKRDALQPFSYGPRNCIGKNLAYAEMRTVLARVMFNFDLMLAPECERWMEDQKISGVWVKPPLMLHLTPRE